MHVSNFCTYTLTILSYDHTILTWRMENQMEERVTKYLYKVKGYTAMYYKGKSLWGSSAYLNEGSRNKSSSAVSFPIVRHVILVSAS